MSRVEELRSKTEELRLAVARKYKTCHLNRLRKVTRFYFNGVIVELDQYEIENIDIEDNLKYLFREMRRLLAQNPSL